MKKKRYGQMGETLYIVEGRKAVRLGEMTKEFGMRKDKIKGRRKGKEMK